MTLSEPTLAPPMAPSTVDMAQIFAAHAERAARIEALRPGNKDRLFDGLKAAGITHVTVTFDGAGDSGQIESIGAWSGETAIEFPATEIEYAALTWDDPEVEMRNLSLEDVVEQLAYEAGRRDFALQLLAVAGLSPYQLNQMMDDPDA